MKTNRYDLSNVEPLPIEYYLQCIYVYRDKKNKSKNLKQKKTVDYEEQYEGLFSKKKGVISKEDSCVITVKPDLTHAENIDKLNPTLSTPIENTNVKIEMNEKGCVINGKPFDPNEQPYGMQLFVNRMSTDGNWKLKGGKYDKTQKK